MLATLRVLLVKILANCRWTSMNSLTPISTTLARVFDVSILSKTSMTMRTRETNNYLGISAQQSIIFPTSRRILKKGRGMIVCTKSWRSPRRWFESFTKSKMFSTGSKVMRICSWRKSPLDILLFWLCYLSFSTIK